MPPKFGAPKESSPFTRSRDRQKNDNWFVEQKNGGIVREYAGYDRLAGFKEQSLLAAFYTRMVPPLNFFHAYPKAFKQNPGRLQENQNLSKGSSNVGNCHGRARIT
jgi:hypothetical protein